MIDDMQQMLAWGKKAWTRFEIHRRGRIHQFVPADYEAVHEALQQLRPRADTFLELGSGVGVVTVLADRLGYRAYGIEVDPFLYARSLELTGLCDSGAVFAHGSFVPAAFSSRLESHVSETLTVADFEPAYPALGMDLDEFDLVYAFPWPGEEELLFELVQRHGAPGALLLTYGATEGCRLYRQGEEVPL